MGGFFGLELPVFNNFPQNDGRRSVMVNSGRAALEYILRSLARDLGSGFHVHVPYYTCATVMEPLVRLGIPHSFYRIDEFLEIDETCFPRIGEGECLIYTNYFGMKQAYVEKLAARFGKTLIIDNCQALYAESPEGSAALYSPRKWSGLADGGVAVLDAPAVVVPETDESWSAASYLLRSMECGVEDASGDCQRSEDRLTGAPLMNMSLLTRRMICGIDYEAASKKRIENFLCLHEQIGHLNKLSFDPCSGFVPFCYPLWTNLPDLRDHLIDRHILIPVLWHDLVSSLPQGSVEMNLVRGLLPLPVDQRYSKDDMLVIAEAIGVFYGL